jgi:UDP-4-amino-4,6-dideoxy-N-acetyl-beta-L-altrosamine transaminase
MISYGRQDITEADIEAVVRALRSDFLTQGPAVPAFEQAVASEVHVKYAIAVNSATSALHIACMALEMGVGDLLWTVPNTFVASANCARYCGADVDFVDIDPATWNMDVKKLEEKLVVARQHGRLPKVVVPVHFAGQPTDQEKIWDLSVEYGFKVLEDASHAIGARHNGEPVGSCRWSHITIFSFHPVKIITTCEGGMLLTNDDKLAESLAMLRSHGITRDPQKFLFAEKAPDAWYYEQQMLGFNYRITDIQATLGISQLHRLYDYVDQRNLIAEKYNNELSALPLQLPTIQPGNRSAFHLYVIRLLDSDASMHRIVFHKLREMGIGVNLHYIPVHLHPYYRELGFSKGQFPISEAYAQSAISIPMYPTLTEADRNKVVNSIKVILGK